MIALGRLEYPAAPSRRSVNAEDEATQDRLLTDGAKRCRVCHRPLTDPAAQRAGIGPRCARKRRRGHR
jgi:hypothetical protein